ncbi:hypothetical protein LINGRAHAP2_LOCUS13739 [Linum grandiflorum]
MKPILLTFDQPSFPHRRLSAVDAPNHLRRCNQSPPPPLPVKDERVFLVADRTGCR